MTANSNRPDGALLHTDTNWPIPVPPDEYWDLLTDWDLYPEFWGWLKSIDVDRMETGGTALVLLAYGPLRAETTLSIDEAVPARLLRVSAHGEIHGRCRLTMWPDGDNATMTRLQYTLYPRRRTLQRMARTMRPLIDYVHEHVVLEAGSRNMIRYIERHRSTPVV